MKKALIRGFVLGLATLAMPVVTSGDALAATAVPISAPGSYATDPSSTPAPADSALNCAVYSQFVNHAADERGLIRVLASSYLQDVYGDIEAVLSAGQRRTARWPVSR